MLRPLSLLASLLTLALGCTSGTWPDGSGMDRWFGREPSAPRGREASPFLITDYGAVPDTSLVQTEAIQRAIDAAAVKGGTVVIPAGIWRSGALFFKKKTHLLLEEGATLKGSTSNLDFPDVPVHIEGILQPWSSALVNADSCDGFSIRGKGTLDGDGYDAWIRFWERRRENRDCTNLEVRRQRLVSISRSRNVTIRDIGLRNSSFWNLHLYKCSRVYIGGIDIYAPIEPVKAPSSDGIDLDACTDVRIVSCTLTTGDDLIAVKGGKGPWADEDPDNGTNSRILVENCSFGKGLGAVVVGSECIGVDNLILRDCIVKDTDKILWFKLRPDTPQRYSNILVQGVSGSVRNVVYAKPYTQFFDLRGRTDLPVSTVENVTVKGCTVKCTNIKNIKENPDQYLITGLNFMEDNAFDDDPDE